MVPRRRATLCFWSRSSTVVRGDAILLSGVSSRAACLDKELMRIYTQIRPHCLRCAQAQNSGATSRLLVQRAPFADTYPPHSQQGAAPVVTAGTTSLNQLSVRLLAGEPLGVAFCTLSACEPAYHCQWSRVGVFFHGRSGRGGMQVKTCADTRRRHERACVRGQGRAMAQTTAWQPQVFSDF
ncbi:hypothetical protein ERJ75_000549700 [Trypanosoma vivax]|nr:hypothetical protein ERJ75_000549700 [Trypanosoma vivax]